MPGARIESDADAPLEPRGAGRPYLPSSLSTPVDICGT